MRLRYDGPRDMVRVKVGAKIVEHIARKTYEYPKAVADELLAESRHIFVAIGRIPGVPRQEEQSALVDELLAIAPGQEESA